MNQTYTTHIFQPRVFEMTTAYIAYKSVDDELKEYDDKFEEYDDLDITDLKVYEKSLYDEMLNYSIFKYGPEDFYVDSNNIIRNRVISEDRHSGMLLFTLDLYFDRIWFYNDSFFDREYVDKSKFIQYIPGVWHKRNAFVSPAKYDTILLKHMGFLIS